MITRTGIQFGGVLTAVTLVMLCTGQVSSAKEVPAKVPLTKATALGSHLDLEGVWEPLGGALIDPAARAMPGNKSRPMTELGVFPPYNAEYQARYDKTTSDLRAGVKIIDGSAKCEPQGMPRMMAVGYPIDVSVQTKRVVMMFEPGAQRRIIYTDGRKHTDPDLIDPTFSGESIGHWEGNVLVVDTVGIRGDLLFDYSFAPHSDTLHIVERISRTGDKLEDQMTFDDPKAFTRPWQVKRIYQLQPTWELKEYVCETQ